MRLVSELRFFDRGIDLYAVAHHGERSYAVELKVEDWQKALRQAAIYQLCADFCYVAMPVQYATKVALGDFREAGIGLLGVHLPSNSVTEILPAEASAVKHHFYSRGFQDSLGSMERNETNVEYSA